MGVGRKDSARSYKKPYDEESKRNAVELLIQSGKPLRTVARELGVSDTVLRSWKEKQLGKAKDDRSPKGEGGATPRELEESAFRQAVFR
jgi:transposase-like protein